MYKSFQIMCRFFFQDTQVSRDMKQLLFQKDTQHFSKNIYKDFFFQRTHKNVSRDTQQLFFQKDIQNFSKNIQTFSNDIIFQRIH